MGLVGFGHIGQRSGGEGRGVGMRVLFFDPVIQEGQGPSKPKKVDLRELVKESWLRLAAHPLLPQTRKMINDEDPAAHVSPTAFLIELIARGQCIAGIHGRRSAAHHHARHRAFRELPRAWRRLLSASCT